jgi:uncharacterized protein (TIGR04255 family)
VELEYIDSRLTEVLDFVESAQLRRSMHSMVIAHDDETQINFNFGIFNQYFPAPITDREFILDLDAYTPFAIEAGDCDRMVEKFNQVIAIYFEASITEKLREEMGVLGEETE